MGEKDAQLNHRPPYLFAVKHFVIRRTISLWRIKLLIDWWVVFDWLLAAFLWCLKRSFTESPSAIGFICKRGSPIYSDGVIVENCEKNLLRGTRILFCGRGPNYLSPY